MSEPPLDDSARKLLDTCLDSFEKLEVVRMLRASRQAMSRSDLAAKCQFATDTVHEVLASLTAMGAVELDASGTLVHLGASSNDPVFDALMKAYENDRMVVLSTLSTIAMERIRSMAGRAFASAFVLRKKGGDDGG